MPKYKATKDIEVSGCNAAGEEVRVSFAKGDVTTSKPDEVALLDSVADDPDNPVGHADKDKEA